jgi:large subunit ribosomal protein L21
VYAIVKSGGKQHKVAVGEQFTVEKLTGEPGATLTLPVLLLVDEGAVTVGEGLAKASVTAEVVEHGKGPKISMIHYKNKTGYKRRQGHRQKNTVLRVTAIEKG